MRMANAKFVEHTGCKEENDSLQSQVRSYIGLTNSLKSSVVSLKEANTINLALIRDKDLVIDLSLQELKKGQWKEKSLKLQRNSVIGVAAALIVKIIFFK